MNGGNLNLGMASLADTGQWKLVVELWDKGISTLLKNIDFEETPSIPLFTREWEDKPEELLDNIETAVYDNPRMLEDFATHIIVTSPKSLWIPTELMEEEEFDENLFTSVYIAESEDIRADYGSEVSCLYTLTPGLNSFLQRTLPGSKVTCHLSVLKDFFERKETGKEGSALYVNLRKCEADIFAFRNGIFLCGATHLWKELPDLAYSAMLVAKAYGLDNRETSLSILGDKSQTEPAGNYFSGFFPSVNILGTQDREDNKIVPILSSLAVGEDIKTISVQ